MAAGSKGRILVVDDDANMARSLTRWLTAAGYETVTALDGREAHSALGRAEFDIVISDLQMPDVGGIDLLRLIRDRDLDLPVLLVTASPSVETAVEAIDLGVTRYLTKPVSQTDLLKAAEAAVRTRRIALLKREALALVGGGLGTSDLFTVEGQFNRALESLWMAFQPIVSWRRKTIYGYEALVRSNEPHIPHPGALFEAAERLGRVPELGAQIRDAAATAFLGAPSDATLFVNLHMLDFSDAELYSTTTAISILASRVVLEVTERSSLDTVKNLRARAAVLRQLGYRMAVDDLGAGYAGLTSFALLEPEVVKLDMSLVRDIDREQTKKRIVRAMVALCEDAGLLVVAEGVETVAERNALAELGCDLMQGYLFAKPGKPFPEVSWTPA